MSFPAGKVGGPVTGKGGSLGGALIGGVVTGALGALVWALLGYYAHIEIGWIAWGIGALVGAGVYVGGGKRVGAIGGVLAVVLALASISAGKYAAVHLAAADAEAEFVKEMESGIASNHDTDDLFVLSIADQLADEADASGKTLDWPNAKSAEDREDESDYPASIMKDARSRWSAMSADEKEKFKASTEAELRASVAEAVSVQGTAIRTQGFVASWGLFDVLFVLLAVASAYRLGSAVSGD